MIYDDDYYDEHEPIAALLRQGKMIHALDQSIECTIDIVRSFYEEVKADEEGKLLFQPEQCDPIDVTIYRFHQQMIEKYETIDAEGDSAHTEDYQFFLSNYQVLLNLRQQCQLSISPQLWDDQATKYVQQAYYLYHELRKHDYDVKYSYIYYEIFKLGYESPLYKHKGECANDFLKLIVQIREEFYAAKMAREKAEEYGVTLPDMPGDRPLLFETYHANQLTERPADPVLWLSMDMTMSTNQMDKRIQWLDTIQYKEADTLSNNGVSADEIGLVKYGCKLLRNFYRRLKGIILRDGEAATYLRSMKPEDRTEAEFHVFFKYVEATEMFAFAQAMCDGYHRMRNIPALQALYESPDYEGKLIANSLYECFLFLCTATRYRQLYLNGKPIVDYSELCINDFLEDYFRIYTELRKGMIYDDIFHSKLSYKKPTDAECLTRLYEESEQCIAKYRDKSGIDAFVLQLCEHYLDYLQDISVPQSQSIPEEQPVPTNRDNTPVVDVELELNTDMTTSFFETKTITSRHLHTPGNVEGHYEYNNKEGLIFYAKDPTNEHNTEVIFPGIYGAIVKLVLDDRFSDAERQYMNQRYKLHQHVDFCLLDHFFEAYLKLESAYYETSEIICDLYHWWKIFSENCQLLDSYYQDNASQITFYIIHYIGVNKSPRPLTPDVIFTEPLADSLLIRWKNIPTPDDLELYGEQYARIKNLLFDKYVIYDRPAPFYIHGFTETLLVLIAENTREETLRSIKSYYINEEKYPRSFVFADDNPLTIIDRVEYLFDESDLAFTFARFSPDDIYEAHLRRAKQDLPEYFHSHRILRKDYEGDKIYTYIFKNELLLAETLLEHVCIKPLMYKTRCEIVSYLGMFLVYMADVYYVDPGYKQIRKVLTPLLDQLHSEDISPKLETYDSVLDENGRLDYEKFGANLLANMTEPINICLKPLEVKLDYTISEDVTPPVDAALEYVRPIFHQVDSLLAKSYTPQWIDDILNYIQEDKSAAFKLQKTSNRVSNRSISLCMGAMMSLGIFGDNKSKNIVETRGLNERTLPRASSVRRDLDKGDYEGSYKAIIQNYMQSH